MKSIVVSLFVVTLSLGAIGYPVEDDDTFERAKRSAESLEEFRQRILEQLNQDRADSGLPLFVVTDELNRGAQEWADHEAETFELQHSCEDCIDYAEILAGRRSSRPLPQGYDAAEWVFTNLFRDPDGNNFDEITKEAAVKHAGFGITFVRNPNDKKYHAYAVVRLARA